jgi:hypothetical protein
MAEHCFISISRCEAHEDFQSNFNYSARVSDNLREDVLLAIVTCWYFKCNTFMSCPAKGLNCLQNGTLTGRGGLDIVVCAIISGYQMIWTKNCNLKYSIQNAVSEAI